MKSLRPQIIRRSKALAEGTSFCTYSHRVCMQMRLDGYEYCARHILEDKSSPFKQCQYVSTKTSKRCQNAALRTDKREGYCPDHSRKMTQAKFRSSRKRRPKETPELILRDLEHYTPRASTSNHSNHSEKKCRTLDSSTAAKVIDYMSSSDSDLETPMIEKTWRGDGDSDAESIDSEQEDPLKHAGVYTAEEVALITRDKLIRLQSLYIDQFKRLQHVMKEKRRRYLHTVRKEREALGSIHYAKDDPEQGNKYSELVAMKRYHRRFGQEALLHRQSKERRIAVSEGINYRPPAYPKCIYGVNGGKCGARTVPLAKYCLEHIQCEPHQILYKVCGYAGLCRHPVIGILDHINCVYHTQLPGVDYRLPRKDEKDDCRDEIDVVGGGDGRMEDSDQSLQLKLQLQHDQMNKLAANACNRLSNDFARDTIGNTRINSSQPTSQSEPRQSHGSIADKGPVTGSSGDAPPQTSHSAPCNTGVAPTTSRPSDLSMTSTERKPILPILPAQPPSPSKLSATEVPQVVNDLVELEKKLDEGSGQYKMTPIELLETHHVTMGTLNILPSGSNIPTSQVTTGMLGIRRDSLTKVPTTVAGIQEDIMMKDVDHKTTGDNTVSNQAKSTPMEIS